MILTIFLYTLLYYLIGVLGMIQGAKFEDEMDVQDFDAGDWKPIFALAFFWVIILPVFFVVCIHKHGFFRMLTKKRTIRTKPKTQEESRAEIVMNAIECLDDEDTDALRRMGVIE